MPTMTRRTAARSASRRLLALACGGLVALAFAAEAAAAPAVEVVLPKETISLDAEQLAGAVDVVDIPYSLLEQDGAAPTEVRMTGVSIREIVRLARRNPDQVEGVTLSAAGGSDVTLNGPDLADPAPFADGPPVVAVEGDAVTFLRPQRDPSDVNGADRISSVGGPLRMEVQAGAPIDVSAGADDERVAPRAKVSFYAWALGADAAERLTFRWDFGDGTTARGDSVVHRYRRPGRYRVVVTVAAASGGGGTSTPISIEVGKPPKKPAGEDEDEDDEPVAASGAYEGAKRGTSGGAEASTRRRRGRKEPRRGEQQRKERRSGAKDRSPAKTDSGLERIAGTVLDAPAAAEPVAAAAAARSAAFTAAGNGGAWTHEALGLAVLGLVVLGAVMEGTGRRRHRNPSILEV
jgi:PKD domain